MFSFNLKTLILSTSTRNVVWKILIYKSFFILPFLIIIDIVYFSVNVLIPFIIWLNRWISLILLVIIRKTYFPNRLTLRGILKLLILLLSLRWWDINIIIIVLLINWLTLWWILVILLICQWFSLRCILITLSLNIFIIELLVWMFDIIKIRIVLGLLLQRI